MTAAVYTALGLAAAWLILALLIPRLPAHRRSLATRITVALGVPVLGLLTLRCGPAVGLAGLGIGMALLLRQRRPRQPAPAPAPVAPAE
ncbi:DUF2484 family protein [uncultured Paracoccus sp.]|uniref:DUF2484 family protein n=1 Tax=uncultured Paracoccus sp. TaxID=189685 RepID=UPI002635498B|nr:DUF2484 family protein [uncultured Paracoccus sp.]